MQYGEDDNARRLSDGAGNADPLGVVLGAAIAGGVSLWQVQLITAREREARQTLREQERKDAHDALQRDAILALHDAITAYWQTVLAAHDQIHNRLTETGQETVD